MADPVNLRGSRTGGGVADHPGLLRALVWVGTVAAVLAIALPAADLAFDLDRLRQTARNYTEAAIRAQTLRGDLERSLADARLARLASDQPALDAARALVEADLASVDRSLEALAASQVRSVGQNQDGSGRELGDLLGRLGVSAREAAATIGSHVPALVAAGTRGRTEDAVDEEALVVPRALVRRVVSVAVTKRRKGLAQITSRERLGIGFGVGVVALVLFLLGGSVSRLIVSRQRLIAARRAETLQAERLVGAVNHMRDGVAVFDAADRLILRNPRFTHAAGLDDGLGAIGSRLAAIAEALADAEPPLLASPRPAPGEPVSGEMRIGKRVLEIYRSAMPGGGQMLAVSDVTPRIEAETIARQAQKMDVLGRLTGGVAHDFNNLLQALTANLETMAALIADPAPTERATKGIRDRLRLTLESVDRGTRLTRHLLAFARQQDHAARICDTAAVLRGLEDLLGRTLGDRIDVRLAVSDAAWPVFVDPGELENAILNLALNARDAMPDGGTVTIAAANESGAGGDMVRISVRDDGVGMSAEQLQRATEPFYTTKPEGLGTGLGLAIVHRFARHGGGRLDLTSTFGSGTEAAIVLPRALGIPAAPQRNVRTPAAAGQGETILLVEDDPAVLEAVRAGLEQLGYRVVQAGDAGAACSLVEMHGLQPDLLLTDVMMPGQVDVAELASRVRVLLPALPIIFNTGDVEARSLREVVFDDRMALLAKPWRLDDLARTIRQLIDVEAPRATRSSMPHAGPGGDIVAPLPPPGGGRVLLLESDPLTRMAVTLMLAEAGWSVAEASRAVDAADSDPPDLLIAEESGRQAGAALARSFALRHPDLRVILTVAEDELGLDMSDERAGYVLLRRPYTLASLRRAITVAAPLSAPSDAPA